MDADKRSADGGSGQPWLVACEANMNPEDFKKGLWYESRHMFIEVPGEKYMHLQTQRSEW